MTSLEPVDYKILGMIPESRRLQVEFIHPYEGFQNYITDFDVPRREDGTINLPALTSLLEGVAISLAGTMKSEYLASLSQEDAEGLFGTVEDEEEEDTENEEENE